MVSPADMVKVRLQCQREPPDSRRRYRGPLHCLLRIARDEGLLGLYKGSSALALRDGPSFATYFLTYSSMCELLRSADGRQTSTCAHTQHICSCFKKHPKHTLTLSVSLTLCKKWFSSCLLELISINSELRCIYLTSDMSCFMKIISIFY